MKQTMDASWLELTMLEVSGHSVTGALFYAVSGSNKPYGSQITPETAIFAETMAAEGVF